MDFELIRSNRRTIGAQIKDGRLIIRAPLRATGRDIDRFISQNRSWIETHLEMSREKEQKKAAVPKLNQKEISTLVKRAKNIIPERVAYYAPMIGVKYGKITIRKQKTRWGSCSGKGNLNFNCLLMLAPPEVIDSVVVHELCHLKQMNHSQKFYDEVLKVFPDYKKHHRWLKENGDMLLAKLG